MKIFCWKNVITDDALHVYSQFLCSSNQLPLISSCLIQMFSSLILSHPLALEVSQSHCWKESTYYANKFEVLASMACFPYICHAFIISQQAVLEIGLYLFTLYHTTEITMNALSVLLLHCLDWTALWLLLQILFHLGTDDCPGTEFWFHSVEKDPVEDESWIHLKVKKAHSGNMAQWRTLMTGVYMEDCWTRCSLNSWQSCSSSWWMGFHGGYLPELSLAWIQALAYPHAISYHRVICLYCHLIAIMNQASHIPLRALVNTTDQ